MRDIGSGWCMGKIGSRTGIFPLSYTWELDAVLIKVVSKDIIFFYCIYMFKKVAVINKNIFCRKQ